MVRSLGFAAVPHERAILSRQEEVEEGMETEQCSRVVDLRRGMLNLRRGQSH